MKEKRLTKRTRRLGHTRIIPEPLTPYPYIATAFFTVIFVNTPLNPYLATGFKPGFKTRTVVSLSRSVELSSLTP